MAEAELQAGHRVVHRRRAGRSWCARTGAARPTRCSCCPAPTRCTSRTPSPPDVVAVGRAIRDALAPAALARRRRRLQPRVPHRAAPPRGAVPLARPHRAAPHQPGRVRAGHRRDDQHRRPGARRPTPHRVAAAGVLFPTVSFAVFFLIAFTVSWLLRPTYRVWLWVMTAISFCVLRLRRRPVRVAARLLDRRGAGRSAPRPSGPSPPTASARRCRRTSCAPRWSSTSALLGLVQVLRLLRRQRSPTPLDSIGLGVEPAAARDRAAGRHLVLHVPRHQLRDRHRPRASSGRCASTSCALYMSFFPHLVAGPIVRASEFAPAAARARRPPPDPVGRGVPADRRSACSRRSSMSSYLATEIVDPVFGAPGAHGSLDLLVGVYAYAIQIYADFSGYTDIAIGCALLLGIRFPQNFDAPVPRAVAPGLLAALAHDAVALAARLPLHPARRQPARRAPDLPQPLPHDGDRRAVARRRRGRSSCGARSTAATWSASASVKAAVGAPTDAAPVLPRRVTAVPPVAAHVQRGVPGVDLLPAPSPSARPST